MTYTLYLFNSKIKFKKFIKFHSKIKLKNFHSKIKFIKFTVEKATDSLPFLDVEIKFDEFGFKTSVWRKPTYTGLLLNFGSTCPNAWKSGLITCSLKRAKIICSDYELFKDEISKLRCIFAKNCYPNWFFNKCLKKFEDNTKPDSHDKEVDDYAYILGLPCFGKPSRKFASQLSTLLKQKFVRIFCLLPFAKNWVIF